MERGGTANPGKVYQAWKAQDGSSGWQTRLWVRELIVGCGSDNWTGLGATGLQS